MSKVLAFVKKKPWIIGGVLVIGVVLFMMMRGGGSANASTSVSTGPSEGLQAAQLQAQTQLGMAQLSANVEGANIAAQLQAFMFGKERDSEVSMYQANVAGQIQMAGIQSQENMANFAAMTQQNIASYGRDIQLAGVDAQKAIALGGQQSQVEIAKLQAGVQNTQTKAQSKSNTLGTIANVAMAAFAIFSDVNTKKQISWSGIRTYDTPGHRVPIELNTYDYQYNWEFGARRSGMIAQDIQAVRPHAVVASRSNRWLAVDYSAV